MEANKINNLSLDGQGSFSNNNVHPDIEPIVEHINDLLQDGNSLQEVVYNLAQETYQLNEISAALEHLGYKPDAIADMFQEIEIAANQQPEMEQPQAGQPESDEQLPEVANQLLNKMQNPQQPSMQLGGMAPAGFDFGFALKDFINEIKGTSDQHLDGTLGSKRHMWEVDFKGANVNPKDYYVTSQGELRNYKEDKKNKKVDPSLFPSSIDLSEGEAIEAMENNEPNIEFIPYQGKKVGSTSFDKWAAANKPKMLEMHFPTTEEILNRNDYLRGQAINLPGGQAIEDIENSQPNSEFTPYPAKPVTSASFNDWLSANKPRIKDLPFERTVKEKLNNENNPFGMNYNPFAINKMYGGDINNFQEGGESYTVKSGDVLSQIAIDNNIPLEDILNANPGLEPDKIQIGQSLVLPKEINDLQNVANKASKRTYKVSDRLEKQRENRKNKIYNDLKSKYIKDLMIQENATKEGWDEEKQLWFPIKAPEGEEGNLDDIGFGYKMSPEEKKLFKNGITNEKLMSLVNKVLKEKEQVAKKYFNDKNYGVNWDELDAPAQILLTDYAYNGALSDFKKFPKAIAEKDKATMLKEYERSSDGKLLTERNKWTKKFIEDNFKYGGLYEASEGIETNEKDKKCLTGNCPPTGLDAKMNSYLKTDAVSDSLQLYNNPDLNNPFSKQAFERLSK
jgi:LysM repeat protein